LTCAIKDESHGCELRRSPGLAVAPALSNEDRCGAFPRCRPAMERLARSGPRIHWIRPTVARRRRFSTWLTIPKELESTIQVQPLSGCPSSRARSSRWLWSAAQGRRVGV